jgi:predicted SnoaL-like aldol condensation-catalyzing enzyme
MGKENGNEAVIRRLVEDVFNRHDLSAMEGLYHHDLVQHSPFAPGGLEATRKLFGDLVGAMPDYSCTIEHLVAQADYVMTFLRWRGTHTGAPFLGLLPTGAVIDFVSAEHFRVAHGRIAEHWDVAPAEALTQLGAARLEFSPDFALAPGSQPAT